MTQNSNPNPANFLNIINDALEGALNTSGTAKPGPGLFDIFTKAAASEAPQPENVDPEAKQAPKASPSPFPNFDMSTLLDDLIKETGPLRKKAQGLFDKVADAEPPVFFTGCAKAFPVPPMDIFLKEDNVEFRFGVPGATAESVEAELDGDRLTVTIDVPSVETEGEVLNREIWAGKSKETFVIPTENEEGLKREVDEENIKASVKDGLVSIVVPFKERVKTKITVS